MNERMKDEAPRAVFSDPGVAYEMNPVSKRVGLGAVSAVVIRRQPRKTQGLELCVCLIVASLAKVTMRKF